MVVRVSPESVLSIQENIENIIYKLRSNLYKQFNKLICNDQLFKLFVHAPMAI